MNNQTQAMHQLGAQNHKVVTHSGGMPLSAEIFPPPQTGLKYDDDKPRMDLLDADAIEGLAKVLTFGAKKYASHNWRGGISYSRVIGALLRHTYSILRGEYTDPESGLPHIDHVGCCWMFLSHFMKNRPDLDDLYKVSNE